MRYLCKILIFFIFIISCKQNSQETLTSPFAAEVIHMNAMSSMEERFQAPTYTFGAHIFQFLKDFDTLDGPYFKIYRGGEISNSSGRTKFIGQKNPKLNYKIVNNISIPKDYSTMAMLSAYYQFDIIATQLQNLTGIRMEDFLNTFGKIEIFFEPKFIEDKGGLLIEQFPKKNAAYLPGLHKFILLSRSNVEQVPFSMNLQVIAHEFGHILWEFAFDNGKTPACGRLAAEFAMSGLNEGFADFFSYTLTGSTNILHNSLNLKKLVKMRNFSITNYKYHQIDTKDSNNSICNQSYYCIGSLFANALFKTQKNLGYDQTNLTGIKGRGEFFSTIINALYHTKNNMINLPKLPNSFNSCTNANNTSSIYNGFVLGAFFNSFLNQITDPFLKNELYRVLVNNFGEDGFPSFSRIGLCL